MLLTDEFMEAVRDGAEFNLKSPKDGSVRGSVDARSLSSSMFMGLVWGRSVAIPFRQLRAPPAGLTAP